MGQSILIVDDDPDAREILELVIGTLELPIRQARDGKEALWLIEEDLPILVILDLSMPRMNGFEVLNVLKADVKTMDLPVIIFSAGAVGTELAELHIPGERILRKGNLSMTHLRERVLEIVGDAVTVDISNQ